jgi:hypothetical protein
MRLGAKGGTSEPEGSARDEQEIGGYKLHEATFSTGRSYKGLTCPYACGPSWFLFQRHHQTTIHRKNLNTMRAELDILSLCSPEPESELEASLEWLK